MRYRGDHGLGHTSTTFSRISDVLYYKRRDPEAISRGVTFTGNNKKDDGFVCNIAVSGKEIILRAAAYRSIPRLEEHSSSELVALTIEIQSLHVSFLACPDYIIAS